MGINTVINNPEKVLKKTNGEYFRCKFKPTEVYDYKDKNSPSFEKLAKLGPVVKYASFFKAGTVRAGSKTLEWYGNKKNTSMKSRYTYKCEMVKNSDGIIRLHVIEGLGK